MVKMNITAEYEPAVPSLSLGRGANFDNERCYGITRKTKK